MHAIEENSLSNVLSNELFPLNNPYFRADPYEEAENKIFYATLDVLRTSWNHLES